MSFVRASLWIVCAALLAAGVVALASRAPASLREAAPPEDATDPSLGASFPDEVVDRHRAYRRAGYAGFAASLALEVVVLWVLARGPLARLVETLDGRNWFVQAIAAALLVAAVTWLAALPLSFVRGYVIEHAWGLSTQDVGGWLTDRLRSLGVGAVIAAVAATAFFGIVRWQPRAWWALGWLGFTALTAALVFLYPVAIAPLFNRFTPLEDEALAARVRALASSAGVDVDEVLVADASRRSTIENAYVAGLGATKQVVVFDTLLRGEDDDVVEFVVAHELGHEIHGHVLKNVVVASAGLLAGFLLLWWLGSREAVWAWGRAGGIADVRALPLLLLFATVLGTLVMPAQAAISRAFERQADDTALELTGDPDTAVRVFRRLALNNLADLDPPAAAVWAMYSHPPIVERIRTALNHRPVTP